MWNAIGSGFLRHADDLQEFLCPLMRLLVDHQSSDRKVIKSREKKKHRVLIERFLESSL